MDRKIRVLEMIDDSTVGGGQVHVLLLAKYLDKNIFEVEVACPPDGFLPQELHKIGIKVVPLITDNILRPRPFFHTINVLRNGNYDVLHTHGGTSGFWGRVASYFLHLPLIKIHTYHGIHYIHMKGIKSKLFLLIDRFLCKKTNRIISVCESDYKNSLNLKISNPEKTVLIYNGIEIDKYYGISEREELRAKYKLSPDKFIFGNVGRLNIQKGQEYLIEAFSKLHRNYPDTLLWIIGSGEEEIKLKTMVENYSLNNFVMFLGDQMNIKDIFSAIDVFVLPSLWEGMPLALLEAMAAGKPVVATNVDGIAEILVDMHNGVLVPPKNTEKLAIAMENILLDNNLRNIISENARKTVSTKYSAQITAQEIGKIYIEEFNKM